MKLEHSLAALLQLHLHSQLNIWLQWIGQRQLQDDTRNITVSEFGVPYIRALTVYSMFNGICRVLMLCIYFHIAETTCSRPEVSDQLQLSPVKNQYHVGDRITYNCVDGYEINGASHAECQSSGIINPPPPTCVEIRCQNPPVIEHGSPVEDYGDGIALGAYLSYVCDPGYNAEGTSSIRCLYSGLWDSTHPLCEIIQCSAPPEVPDGSYVIEQGHSVAENAYGTVVYYTCDAGHTMMGESLMSCREDGFWNTSSPQCHIVICPTPPAIDNGWIEVTSYEFNSTVSYSCSQGYVLVGVQNRTCTSAGEWGGVQPVCELVSCGTPPDLEHGWVEGDQYRHGDSVRYFCDVGFDLKGRDTRRCLWDGHWEYPLPYCNPIFCPVPARLNNGVVSGHSYGYQDMIQYSCHPGYLLVGSSIRTCEATAKWNGTDPTCQRISCQVPRNIAHGMPLNVLPQYPPGSTVSYGCDEGYEIKMQRKITCGQDGAWSGPMPRCTLVHCNALVNVTNGYVNMTDTVYESVAVYSCHEGYRLVGTKRRSCTSSKQWDSSEPECLPLLCPPLSHPENGFYDESSRQVFTKVKYGCEAGFNLSGPNETTCLSNGTWSHSAPLCLPILCGNPALTIQNGRMISTNFSYNSTIHYVCNSGYEIPGRNTRRCAADKTWEGDEPTCEPVWCPLPVPGIYGMLKYHSYHFKSVANYSCVRGFELFGVKSRVCQANGTWSGETPECRRIMCPPPPSVTHGRINSDDFSYNARVQYMCESGYLLHGNDKLKCGIDRRWRGELPSCNRIECREPPAIMNGVIETPSVIYGESPSYRCDDGYALDAPIDLICSANGIFIGNNPQCFRIFCPMPEIPPHGKLLKGGNSFMDVVSYQCEPGFYLNEQSVRTCLSNGRWNGTVPHCLPIECPSVDEIENGRVDVTQGYLYGNVIMYTCNSGFELIGVNERFCSLDGTWSDSAPYCRALVCEMPNIRHGDITMAIHMNGSVIDLHTATMFLFGDEVTFDCNDGYILDGEPVTKCMADQNWRLPLPECQPVTCDRVVIHNAVIMQNDISYFTEQSTVYCIEGHDLIGPDVLKCEADGSWSPDLPECVIRSCSTPEIDNGEFTLTDGSFRWEFEYGDMAIVRCDIGYEYSETNPVTCRATGTWSSPIGVCEPTACHIEDIHNQLVIEPLGTEHVYGAVVRFHCDGYYELDGEESIECGPGHIWTAPTPTCVPILCDAPRFLHGHIFTDSDPNPTTFPAGTKIYFRCPMGRRLVGVKTSVCHEDRSWSSEPPVCEMITCPLPEVTNSLIILSSGPSSDKPAYGTVMSLRCEEGFTVSRDAELHCRQDGLWDGLIPTCERNICDTPAIENGYIVTNVGGPRLQFGNTFTVQCDDGFSVSHDISNIITCLADGTLDQSVPECERVTCQVPNIHNGKLLTDETEREGHIQENTISYQSNISIECDEGFYLDGFQSSMCHHNRSWYPLLGVCQRIVCPSLTLEHGVMSSLSTLYGTDVTFSCDPGYRLQGEVQTTCTGIGQWNSTSPTCEPVTCNRPTIMNGQIDIQRDVNGDGIMGYEDVINFECNEGFDLNGIGQVICQNNGEWSNTVPSCEMITCLPPTIENAVFYPATDTSMILGSQVRVDCLDAYTLQGDSVMQCLEDGEWGTTSSMPSCELVFCTEPYIANGHFTGDRLHPGFTYGENIHVSCNTGFQLNGDVDLVCDSDATWSAPMPVCDPIGCAEPDITHAVVRGALNGHDGGYVARDIINIECEVGFELSGQNQLFCDLNGEWNTAFPRCHAVRCPRPYIENGHVEGSLYTYGERVKFICNAGFELVGPLIVTCQADRQWTFRSYCRPITCRIPPKVPHATYSVTGYKYGDTITYKCRPGYVMAGDASHECRADKSWGDDFPSCRPVECSAIQVPANGFITFQGDRVESDPTPTFTFGNKVRFDCDIGYNLEGPAYTICQSTGTWSQRTPRCQLISCGEPEAVENAMVHGTSYSYKDTVEYVCNEGYEMEGVAVFRCTKRGNWKGNDFSCRPKLCQNPPVLENGQIRMQARTYGSSVVYQCHPGFHLVGDETRICQADQQWSGMPPSCLPINCTEPVTIEHGTITGSLFVFKSTVKYDCEVGYELHGSAERTCEYDGQWTGTQPVCKKVVCPPPQRVLYGRIHGKDYSYGSQVEYVCDDGYQLNGTQYHMCNAYGIWSSTTPYCEVKHCDTPGAPGHGRVVLPSNMLSHGAIAVFRCDPGFQLVGGRTMTCHLGETWHGRPAHCERISCGLPTIIEHGELDDNAYEYNDTTKLRCQRGYQIEGDPMIECEADGMWSPVEAACVPVNCSSPVPVANAVIKGHGYKYGDFLFYHCNTGYEMTGNNLLQCGETGQWNGGIPTCNPVTCGPVTFIPHATVTVSRTTYGSKARYLCDRGYILHGSPMITCLENGTWMYDSAPRCEPTDCGRPPMLHDGQVTYEGTTLSNIAHYHCNRGHRLSMNTTLQCGPTGRWMGPKPTCIKITCIEPELVLHGGFITTALTVGGMTQYHCDQGYVLHGDEQSTCTPEGTWDKSTPTCEGEIHLHNKCWSTVNASATHLVI